MSSQSQAAPKLAAWIESNYASNVFSLARVLDIHFARRLRFVSDIAEHIVYQQGACIQDTILEYLLEARLVHLECGCRMLLYPGTDCYSIDNLL